jgi:peptide methionine sulfoxide reductase MsrA
MNVKQLDLPLPKIPRGQIDSQEYARVLNKEGHFQEYVHGTYDEVEDYCKDKGYWVDRYFDHVDPMTVQKGFRYIGSGHNPAGVSRPFDYKKGIPDVKDKW